MSAAVYCQAIEERLAAGSLSLPRMPEAVRWVRSPDGRLHVIGQPEARWCRTACCFVPIVEGWDEDVCQRCGADIISHGRTFRCASDCKATP